ncbi:MAG: hypothetical protein H0X51_01620 [Parachlamydiaceae bacterium]|nr:hypothetical protein [Parachlamydiaceae bacterium]
MSKTLWLAAGASLVLIGFLMVKTAEMPTKPGVETQLQTAKALPQQESNIQSWHEFVSPSKTFKVLLPSLPQHATEKLDNPKTKEVRKYEMYVSEKDNGTIFMISLITMLDSSSARIDKEVLTNVVNELVANNAQSKIKKMEMGTYKGYSSLDFSVENEKATIDGKAFIVNDTLYLLTSAAQVAHFQQAEYDFFINSFQLTPQLAPSPTLERVPATPIPETKVQ